MALGLFIASNLALGVTFSTIARNQMQAVQMAQFTLLPSFMLSGFMFPFRGMPVWARASATSSDHPRAAHRPRRAAEGQRVDEIAPDIWPMALFTVIVIVFAVWRYRETLD